MASDLEHESLRQAGHVDNADLTRLAVLYERIIQDGVLPHARALPQEEQRERLPALAAELRETEQEAERTAVQAPVAAEPLRRLARTAGEASRFLQNTKLDLHAHKPRAPEPSSFLVETLVVQGLRLADENDPLKRAEVCTDVADDLVRTIMEASRSASDRDEMVKLGTYLGAVMDQAVDGNLKRVQVNAEDEQRRAEYDRIRQRAGQTVENLERNLLDAPALTRPALEQAIQASKFATLEGVGPKR